MYVYSLLIRYIHVLLKFFPHPNELSCMHPTLEATVVEYQPKNTKPKSYQNREIKTDICSHKLFGWQGEEG